jgi:hypothetical protein
MEAVVVTEEGGISSRRINGEMELVEEMEMAIVIAMETIIIVLHLLLITNPAEALIRNMSANSKIQIPLLKIKS